MPTYNLPWEWIASSLGRQHFNSVLKDELELLKGGELSKEGREEEM